MTGIGRDHGDHMKGGVLKLLNILKVVIKIMDDMRRLREGHDSPGILVLVFFMEKAWRHGNKLMCFGMAEYVVVLSASLKAGHGGTEAWVVSICGYGTLVHRYETLLGTEAGA